MSMTHWLVVALVVLLLFGRGKISELMGDVAKGIKSFKKGMAEDDVPATEPGLPPKPIEHRPISPSPATAERVDISKS
jgi:sec-independent protein translocase protein TatA